MNIFYSNFFLCKILFITGKSISEALVLAATNPQYEKRTDLVIQWTIFCHILWLVDNDKLNASEKDLPVKIGPI